MTVSMMQTYVHSSGLTQGQQVHSCWNLNKAFDTLGYTTLDFVICNVIG